jgi:hypothetical protein
VQLVLGLGLGVLLSIAVIGFAVYKVRARVRALRTAGRARADAEVLRGRTPAVLDDSALFFGLQSKGPVQLRGNGCLVLVDDELVFLQWVTDRVVRVPLADVIAVDTARGHLGKRIARDLLRVRWRVDGREETAAWFVHDLAAWLDHLRGTEAGVHAAT